MEQDITGTEHQESAHPGKKGISGALVISRVTVNYVITAVAFFLLGALATLVVTSSSMEGRRAENRELIDQAIAAVLNAGEASAAGPQGPPQPAARLEVSADDDPTRGSAEAAVLMVEFSDFNCPYCGRFARETLPQLLDAYEGKIRLVYRDFPILGDSSLQAAIASECAEEQGAYWAYHDLLFANQRNFDDKLVQFAQELNLDVEGFTSCQNDPAFRDEVLADYADAQRLGATGSPTFFINGRLVVGAQPFAAFAAVIDEELAAAEPASSPPAS